MPAQAARPFINYRIEQLEAIFADHPSLQALRQLLRELKERREWGRAGDLRSRVERELARLNEVHAGRKDDDVGPSSTTAPSASGDGFSHRVDFGRGFSSEPEVVDIIGLDGGPEPDEDTIDGGPADNAAVAGHRWQQPRLFPEEDLEETVPPTKERRPGRMRAPGSLPDVPAKWTPEPKKDFVPTWKWEDPPLKRYEGALRALIDELRKRTKVGQQVQLQNGCRVTIDGEDAAYQFAWAGDEDLFEGANVKAIADGRHTVGRLVSITPLQLVVALDDDFGPNVSQCALFVDNTAMLEALANRLKDIADKKPASFNLDLAEDAVANRSEEAPVAEVLPELLNGLLPLQAKAVQMAAGNRVTYLWGPPGTGKTRALGALARHFSAAEKKILIASNTNQAVDLFCVSSAMRSRIICGSPPKRSSFWSKARLSGSVRSRMSLNPTGTLSRSRASSSADRANSSSAKRNSRARRALLWRRRSVLGRLSQRSVFLTKPANSAPRRPQT
jgi:hypothetical protein